MGIFYREKAFDAGKNDFAPSKEIFLLRPCWYSYCPGGYSNLVLVGMCRRGNVILKFSSYGRVGTIKDQLQIQRMGHGRIISKYGNSLVEFSHFKP